MASQIDTTKHLAEIKELQIRKGVEYQIKAERIRLRKEKENMEVGQ